MSFNGKKKLLEVSLFHEMIYKKRSTSKQYEFDSSFFLINWGEEEGEIEIEISRLKRKDNSIVSNC